jgi:uncharacterized coiled-coil protein SlyX
MSSIEFYHCKCNNKVYGSKEAYKYHKSKGRHIIWELNEELVKMKKELSNRNKKVFKLEEKLSMMDEKIIKIKIFNKTLKKILKS